MPAPAATQVSAPYAGTFSGAGAPGGVVWLRLASLPKGAPIRLEVQVFDSQGAPVTDGVTIGLFTASGTPIYEMGPSGDNWAHMSPQALRGGDHYLAVARGSNGLIGSDFEFAGNGAVIGSVQLTTNSTLYDAPTPYSAAGGPRTSAVVTDAFGAPDGVLEGRPVAVPGLGQVQWTGNGVVSGGLLSPDAGFAQASLPLPGMKGSDALSLKFRVRPQGYQQATAHLSFGWGWGRVVELTAVVTAEASYLRVRSGLTYTLVDEVQFPYAWSAGTMHQIECVWAAGSADLVIRVDGAAVGVVPAPEARFYGPRADAACDLYLEFDGFVVDLVEVSQGDAPIVVPPAFWTGFVGTYEAL